MLRADREISHFSAQVITSRSYDDRLDTISAVRDAGISVCSGGILGLGESDKDRVGLIWEVAKCARSFPSSTHPGALTGGRQHARTPGIVPRERARAN